ncbi:MAG: terminase [Woeseia sp.]
MSVDWCDYERVHADRRNLIIHLLAVPLFDIAFPAAVIVLVQRAWLLSAVSILVAIATIIAQGLGHSKERVEPRPFTGPLDFLKRWFSEQYFKFPAFVLTGRWWGQYESG